MFEVFNKILANQSISKEELEKINSYIFCRWLTGNSTLIPLANELNKYPNIDTGIMALAVRDALNGNLKYLSYPKSEKPTFKYEDIEDFMDFYDISRSLAVEYIELLSRDPEAYEETIKRIKLTTANRG